MAEPLFLGIDVGTTGTKAVLCDALGRVQAQAGQEYPTAYPQPGWAEQDPDDWWRAACQVVRRVLEMAACRPADVAGVSVSSQAPTLVAVDSAGEPICPALIWMDRRSEPQCEHLRQVVGDAAIAAGNGGRADPYYLAPKLLWLRAAAPELYSRCAIVLQANGYVVQRLCSAQVMDSSHGPLSLCFDSTRQDWSAPLTDAMGIDRRILPPVAPCTQVVGAVHAAAAQATGLCQGTPVIAGMVDGTAAGIEAGLVQPGDAAEMTGQSTVLLVCSDRPYQGAELIPVGHAVPGLHLVVGAQVASGGALRWFRDQLGEPERLEAQRRGVDPFELLSAEAAASPPGANRLVFLPYLYGERSPIWDTNARGVFFGLSLATQKRDLIRAIMEGAAYGLRHNIAAAEAAGFRPAALACVGGGARSAVWNQIKADVLNRPVHLPQAALGAPMGDAIAAAVGVGAYPSIAAAVAQMVKPGPVFTPRPEYVERYNALFAVYRSLYPALRELFVQLAAVESEQVQGD